MKKRIKKKAIKNEDRNWEPNKIKSNSQGHNKKKIAIKKNEDQIG
jgi:hypothetical protein